MTIVFKKLLKILALLALSFAASAQVWSPVSGTSSPGYGNDVRSYSSSPESALSWWIATDGAGLFKTLDGGANWVSRNNGIGHLRTVGLWIDTGSLPGATTTAYKVIASTTGGGVYISNDSGATFTAANTGLGCTYVRSVRVLAKSTLANARLLAATDCGKASGIYYSNDAGLTWAMSTGLATDNITVFGTSLISPLNTDGTAAATPYLLANTSQGIYKSTDNGLTWAALPSSPTGPNGSVVYSVTWSYISGASPSMRLIATVEGAGVFKSDDNGASWTSSNAGLPSGVIVPMSSASQDGSSTNTFYLALDGAGTYRSTDRGATWSVWKTDAELPAVRQIAHRYNPAGTASDAYKKILWAATLAGAYISQDAGVTWSKGAGLPAGQMANTGFATDGYAYAAASDGVYKAGTNNLKSWTKLPGLPKVNHVIVRGTEVWAATTSNGVYKLQNTVWKPVNQGLPSAMVYKNPVLRVDPLNTQAWYVGLGGAGMYYFDGNTWMPRNNGLSGDALKVRFVTTYADRILISTQAGLFTSVNQGQSWTQIGPKDSSGNWIRPQHTAVDPLASNTIYLSVYNTDPVGVSSAGNGLWKSTDSGATWSEITKFRGSRMDDVRALNSSAGLVLIASSWDDNTTTGGVFASRDNGQNWVNASAGLSTTLVAAVNAPSSSSISGAPLLSSRAGLYVWSSPLGMNEQRSFMTANINGALHYLFSYRLSDSASKVTGLTLTAGTQTVQATSFKDSSGTTYWQAMMDLGTSLPASSLTYTANIATTSGALTDAIQGTKFAWNTAMPSAILPNQNSVVSAGSVNFTWNPPANANSATTYEIRVGDSTGQSTLWSTSIWAGQPSSYAVSNIGLTAGTRYTVSISALNTDPFNNVTVGSVGVEPFCYACNNSGGGNQQSQNITINAPTYMVAGTSGSVSASSSSGLAVQLSTTTPQICTIATSGSANTVSYLAAGTCQLFATQSGSSTFLPGSLSQTVLVSASNPTPIDVSWKPIAGSNGPGYGGVVRTSSTSTDGKLWIATEGGGLYVTADNGSNWTAMNNGITDLRLWGLAISQPASGAYQIWAASMGGGVYYSADSGQTFVARNTGLKCVYVKNLRMIGNRLFAATDCGSNSGVYYSDDQGLNWTLSTGEIPSNVRVNSMSYVNPTGVTAYLLANTSVGVFKSTNNGASFTALTSSPGTAATQGTSARQNTYGITWSYTNSTLTLLATVEGLGVYRSTDGGVTWTTSNTGMPSGSSLVALSSVSTNGTGTFYVALDRFGVYKSVDQGLTWSSMASDAVLPSARYIAFAFGTMYAATQAGPYFSADGGLNWVKGGAGLPGGMLANVSFMNNGDTYVGSADGVYKLNPSNQNWVKIPGLPSTRSVNINSNGADLFAATDSYGVYKLVNSNQWAPINTGLPTDLVYTTPNLKIDSTTSGALLAGMYGPGVYYFDPAAQAWQARNNGLTGNALKVRYLANSGSSLLASTESGVYISQDKGLTWSLSGLRDASSNVLRADHVVISRQNSNTYYAAVYNTDSLGATYASNGLWVSSDRGLTWSQVPALAGFKVHDVRSFYTGGGYILTAASWDSDSSKRGLWISEDNGVTWKQFSAGLSNTYVNGVFVDANHDGPGYLTTRGNGLFYFSGSGNADSSVSEWRNFNTRQEGSSTYYSVYFGVDDPKGTVSKITLTNGTVSNTATLSSNSYGGLSTGLNFSNTAPAVDANYVVVESFVSGATPKATSFKMRSQGWNTKYPTNISVTAGTCATCPAQITWSPASNSEANTSYRIRVSSRDSNGSVMWDTNLGVLSEYSVPYAGGALTNGVAYDVVVTAQVQDVLTDASYSASAAIIYTPGTTDARAVQTLTFPPISSTTLGAMVTLTATASSGGTVYFSTDTPGQCSVNGNTLSLNAAGTCIVKAIQAGSASYKPVTATQTISIGGTGGGMQPQTLTFASVALSVGGTANLSATTSAPSSANLPITFGTQTPSTCAVTGSQVAGLSAGVCALYASQAGNSTYMAASASQYVVVSGGSVTSTTVSSTTTTTAINASVNLVSGWNLLGNGFNFGINVASIFGNADQIATIWKWVADSNKWAFYAPSLSADALASYAAGKGYAVLSTINPGEGFWVNANVSSETPLALRSDQSVDPLPYASSNFALGGIGLPSSWSLIAIGDRKSPKEFNQNLNPLAGPPSVGGATVAENLTTLWAWDMSNPTQPGWFFYAPNLENKNTLDAYITTKQYRNFGASKLTPTTGFWVNMP